MSPSQEPFSLYVDKVLEATKSQLLKWGPHSNWNLQLSLVNDNNSTKSYCQSSQSFRDFQLWEVWNKIHSKELIRIRERAEVEMGMLQREKAVLARRLRMVRGGIHHCKSSSSPSPLNKLLQRKKKHSTKRDLHDAKSSNNHSYSPSNPTLLPDNHPFSHLLFLANEVLKGEDEKELGPRNQEATLGTPHKKCHSYPSHHSTQNYLSSVSIISPPLTPNSAMLLSKLS